MARQAARLKQLTVFSGKLRRNAISNRETTPRFDQRYEARFAVKESFQIADPTAFRLGCWLTWTREQPKADIGPCPLTTLV